jgi:hypothetical protein
MARGTAIQASVTTEAGSFEGAQPQETQMCRNSAVRSGVLLLRFYFQENMGMCENTV